MNLVKYSRDNIALYSGEVCSICIISGPAARNGGVNNDHAISGSCPKISRSLILIDQLL